MSEKPQKNRTDHGLRRLLRHVPGPVGGAAGSALGVGLGAVGIPGGEAIGAVLGSSAGNLLTGLGQDIWERHLSHREKKRLGTVLGVVIADIHRRREAGEIIRTDAAEVAESVLLKAQREPEEKKIPYMGYLFSSIAFDPQISVQMAHQLVKTAEQLTYRQLCILRLSKVKDEYGLRDNDYSNHGPPERDLYQVLYECAELYNKEYMNFRGHMDYGIANLIPSRMTLQGVGADLYNLMKLSNIPDADIVPIAEQLK